MSKSPEYLRSTHIGFEHSFQHVLHWSQRRGPIPGRRASLNVAASQQCMQFVRNTAADVKSTRKRREGRQYDALPRVQKYRDAPACSGSVFDGKRRMQVTKDESPAFRNSLGKPVSVHGCEASLGPHFHRLHWH